MHDGMIEPTYTVAPGENVTRRGSDLARGDLALQGGRRLGPTEMGVLAALGVANVPVFKRPSFAVISTGDELVSAWGNAVRRSGSRFQPLCDHRRPARHGLRRGGDRSDPRRRADAPGGARCGAAGLRRGRASAAALRSASAIWCPEVVASLGEPGVIVHGLRVRPGKPTMLGAVGAKPVIGLPGNPTSALMMLEAVVRPAIVACTGERALAPTGVVAFAREPFVGREGWTWFMPAHLEIVGGRLLASPLKLHSAHVSLLARAHGYVVVGEVKARIEAGEAVRVETFSSAGPPVGEG